jgi:hypothetical protein
MFHAICSQEYLRSISEQNNVTGAQREGSWETMHAEPVTLLMIVGDATLTGKPTGRC